MSYGNVKTHYLHRLVVQDFFHFDGGCGSIVERFWFNSAGVGIHVDDDVPLHVSFNQNNDGRFVLKADYDKSEYRNLDGKLPQLK